MYTVVSRVDGPEAATVNVLLESLRHFRCDLVRLAYIPF
jgi:hypothetical protein